MFSKIAVVTWMMSLLFLAVRAFNVDVWDLVYRVGDLLPKGERKVAESLNFSRQNARNNVQSDYSTRQYPADNFQPDYSTRQDSADNFQPSYPTRQYSVDNSQSTDQSQYSIPNYSRYQNDRSGDGFTTLNCSGYFNRGRLNNFSAKQCGCPCRFRRPYYASQSRYRSQVRRRNLLNHQYEDWY